MMTAPAFLEIMAAWQPHFVPVDERPSGPCQRAERLPFRERLWTALDLLSALDEAVGPVRDQLMQELSNLLHSHILHPTLRLNEQQLGTVMRTLSELDHEATRAVPNAAQFCRSARLLVDVMLLA